MRSVEIQEDRVIKRFSLNEGVGEMSFYAFMNCDYIIRPVSMNVQCEQNVLYGQVVFQRYMSIRQLMEMTKSDSIFTKEEWIVKFIHDLVSALVYLEKMEVIHNDIKLENVVYDIDNDRFLLIDFGNAQLYGFKQHSIGTYYISSPESLLNNILRNNQPNQYPVSSDIVSYFEHVSVSNKSDMWGFGCTLYEYITEQPAYPLSKTLGDALTNIRWHSVNYNKVPPPFDDIIKRCLVVDIAKRIDIHSLGDYIDDKYLHSIVSQPPIRPINDINIHNIKAAYQYLYTVSNKDIQHRTACMAGHYVHIMNYRLTKRIVIACLYIFMCCIYSIPSLEYFCLKYEYMDYKSVAETIVHILENIKYNIWMF